MEEENVGESPSPSIRRSARKKFQPDHYGHSSPLISSPPTVQKPNDAEEVSDDDAENAEQHSDSSVDSDVPLSHFTPSRAKKTPVKSAKKKKVGKARTPRAKKGGAFTDGEIPAGDCMFDIIRGGKGALQTVVDDWIESYNKDNTSAMVDLIQFIIQCCGCKGVVTEDMLEEEENVNAIRKLTEEFDEDSDEYPLTMSGPTYKKFKNNFSEFIECLIQQCQHSIVYDEFMMAKLIEWLISLSDSQVRAFRHTSTLAGMKLVAALIQIALKVNVELDNTQRQLDSEKQKAASKRGVQKIEMLQNKKNQLRDNVKALEEHMSFIFQGIFVHRYRDIRPEIRSLCISEIGCWMKDYSSLFLSHKYLKYVVWTLHDKVGDVRLHALQSLLKLYEVEEFLPQLEPLTSRFKGRIVAMTLDKENDVTVEAIKLVILLYGYEELDQDDCQQVQQLVFCNHRLVSHQAGYFLHCRLMNDAENNSPSKRGKKSLQQRNCEYLKRLIDFFITSRIHEHASYLVDSLWQHCELLKDWQLMTGMLLDDAYNEDLSPDEETALIEIMTCCCRQAATGQGPPGRIVKRLLSTKEKKTIINDKQEMSAHFMEKLPTLLAKYGTEASDAENLIAIPQYFDLEEYSQRRLGKQFEDLLNQIDDLVQKGPETPLLEECSKTYKTLIDNELTLSSKAEVTFTKLIDNVVQLFKDACVNLSAEKHTDEDEDNSDAYVLEVNLKRITAFYKSHNLNRWDIYDNLSDIMKSEQSDEIICMTLTAMEMLLIWSLHELDKNHPDKRSMKTLRQRFISYVDKCSQFMSYDNRDVIQKHTFLCLCDILVVFAKQIKNTYPLFAPVIYEPPEELQSSCAQFVDFYVFNDENETEANEDEDNTDAEVEELNSKRLVLAGFCKFIAFGIFDMARATRVFSKMITGFGNFGDIIKHTMAKCREINKIGYTKTVALTLTNVFSGLLERCNGKIEKDSQDFVDLKELAKRLTLTFGIDPNKSNVRTSMVTLHRELIRFSLTRKTSSDVEGSFPHLRFFDLMSDCVSRLIPQDRKVVLDYLQEQAGFVKINLNKPGKGFQSLSTYYQALKETNHASTKTPRSKPQKAKRKLQVEEVETERTKRLRTEEVQDTSETGEQNETPSTPNSETGVAKENNSKRKRHTDDEESAEPTEHGENSEDEFEESERGGKASQRSWFSSQPKKNIRHANVSYGTTKSKAVDKQSDTIIEEEEEKDLTKENNESSSPPEARPPRAKRTKKSFPENIFEESPAVETPSDDEEPPAAF